MKKNSLDFLLKSKIKFFRNLFFYYNIYIRNFKFFFEGSQFGESKEILKFLKEKKIGKYVDLGCFHPIRHNNTIELYRKKWQGINVDLNPLSIELFNFYRPKDININCAVSHKQGITYYFSNNILSPLNTLEKTHLSFLKKKFNISSTDFKKIKVQTFTLDEILERNKFYRVDFLNIDLEGHEFKVLRRFNFKRFSINIICIEMLSYNSKSLDKNNKIHLLLKKNRFKLIKKVGLNHIYQCQKLKK